MLTFFPEPYEDELLYSVLARYHIRSANLSAKHTLMELYGCTSVTASMELPGNINTLSNSLPKSFSFSAEDIIFNHTLYPFYSAFMTEKRAKEVYELMLGNEGSKIFSAIGASNKQIKSNQNLRFCKDCVKEDIVKYGETYWHRIHQIPKLCICLKHKKILMESTAEIHLKNRQEYINATMEICSEHYHNGNLPIFKPAIEMKNNDVEMNDIIDKSILLGNNVKFLLDNKVYFKEDNYFRDIYIGKLIEKGYAERKNLINQEELLRAFKNHYGENFLNLTQSNYEIGTSNWVTNMSRKHRNGFHPIQHLLFMQFLDITAEDIFTNKIRIQEVKKRSYSKSEDEHLTYRNKWLDAIRNNPGKSKTFIRDNNCSIYTWLYKYDKRWLDENSPKRKVGIRKESVVDWNKRDQQCLELVKEQVTFIKERKEKPERITIGLIGRKIKKLTLLQKHLDKMPKTKEYLGENIETVEEVQIRRIKWAVEKLAEEDIVREWKVVELAGLNKKSAKNMKAIILEYTSKC